MLFGRRLPAFESRTTLIYAMVSTVDCFINKQTKNIANLDLTAKNNLCSSIYVLLFSAV